MCDEGGTRITTGGREQLPGAGRTPRRCCAGARRCYSCPGCSSTPPSTLRSPAHPSYTPANRAMLYPILQYNERCVFSSLTPVTPVSETEAHLLNTWRHRPSQMKPRGPCFTILTQKVPANSRHSPLPLVLQTKAIRRSVITKKAPTRAFSWLKAATTAFTFHQTLLRHYAKRALTPWCLNVKLGPRRNYHKGRAAIRHYANQTARPL